MLVQEHEHLELQEILEDPVCLCKNQVLSLKWYQWSFLSLFSPLPHFFSASLVSWNLFLLLSVKEVESTTQFSRRTNGGHAHVLKAKGASESRESLRSSCDTVSEASQATEMSQVDSIQSVPEVSASTDFAWAKKGRGNGSPVDYAIRQVQGVNILIP